MSRRSDRTRRSVPKRQRWQELPQTAPLRIIGGRFRGRKLAYSGQQCTRPMKARLREAVFSLVGPGIRGSHAIDLFAGTGALALEALSRGAIQATLVERHVPTVRIIRQNIETLGVADATRVVSSDAFTWVQRLPDLGNLPWTVFCSPPYDYYRQRRQQMLELIRTMQQSCPSRSVLVVEASLQFDASCLPEPHAWELRAYRPAMIAIHRVPASAASGPPEAAE